MGTNTRKIIVASFLVSLVALAGLLLRSPSSPDPSGRPVAEEVGPPAPDPMIGGTSPLVDEPTREDFTLEPSRERLSVSEHTDDTSLLVRVFDRATGEPVPEFSAVLMPEHYVLFSDAERFGVSDDRGEILWEGLDEDRVVIRPPFSEEYFTLERGRRNERVHEVDLKFTINGIVVDGRDQPVQDAAVWTFSYNVDNLDQRIAAITDEQGRFSLRMYASESVWAFARALGRAQSRTASVSAPKEGSEVELRLGLGDEVGTIVGDVVEPEGGPIAGAMVRFRGSTASVPPQMDLTKRYNPDRAAVSVPVPADERGQFRFEAVPAGEATLMVTAPGWAGTVAKVDVVAGGTSSVRVSMTAGARLVGTARTTDGEPLANVTVVARRHSFARRSTVTGPDGGYDLRHVQPGSSYLEAHLASLPITVRDRVEFSEGEEFRWDPVFSLGGGEIRGTILTFDGGPFREGSVRVRDEDGGFRPGRTDAEGRFAIDGLQDRPYEVVVYPPGIVQPVTVAEEVRPADRELVLRMPEVPAQDAYATGRVLDPSGEPITNLRVVGRELIRQSIAVSADASSDGRFQIGPMIPGSWTFTLELQDYPKMIEHAVIEAGETADLGTLWAAEAVPVEVAVLGAEGNVVALLWGEGLENERVLVESGQVLLPPLAAGDYHLDFFGERVARQSVAVSLISGRSARYEVVLEPGISRSVQVVLPEGAESSLLRLRTLDDEGRELVAWRLTWYASWGPRAIPFRPQAAVLVVTSEDGKRGEARLESEEVRVVLR